MQYTALCLFLFTSSMIKHMYESIICVCEIVITYTITTPCKQEVHRYCDFVSFGTIMVNTLSFKHSLPVSVFRSASYPWKVLIVTGLLTLKCPSCERITSMLNKSVPCLVINSRSNRSNHNS